MTGHTRGGKKKNGMKNPWLLYAFLLVWLRQRPDELFQVVCATTDPV